MRGHFLSGTRKLNRHYQSASGWRLIADKTHTWLKNQNVIKDGVISGYIPFDGVGNDKFKIPLKVGTRFKIVSSLPLYNVNYGVAEHSSQFRGMTIGFAKLNFKKGETRYFKDGLSNFDVLYPQPKPFYGGIVFYNDDALNEPMLRIRYYADETMHTVFMELDKIYDPFSDISCEGKIATLDYRGSCIYAYLNYFSQQPVENFNTKMYIWE